MAGWLTVLLVAAAACLSAVIASVVITWASHRSALWNMLFAFLVALAVFALVTMAGLLVVRAAFPR